jgi:hypothetical protein
MARARTKDVSMLYADEDVLENDGLTRTRPFLKPDWSPDMLLSLNYLGHAAVTRDLFDRSGASQEVPKELFSGTSCSVPASVLRASLTYRRFYTTMIKGICVAVWRAKG